MRSVYIPGVFRPRGVAWLSLLAIAVGLGYVTTAAMRTTEPMSSHATMTETGSPARIRLTEAQVVERLRPMLAQRGFESDVIDGPMLARAPGQLAEVLITPTPMRTPSCARFRSTPGLSSLRPAAGGCGSTEWRRQPICAPSAPSSMRCAEWAPRVEDWIDATGRLLPRSAIWLRGNPGRDLGAGVDVQLGENVRDVSLDGRLGDYQLFGNQPVTAAGGDKASHFALSEREKILGSGATGRRLGWRARRRRVRHRVRQRLGQRHRLPVRESRGETGLAKCRPGSSQVVRDVSTVGAPEDARQGGCCRALLPRVGGAEEPRGALERAAVEAQPGTAHQRPARLDAHAGAACDGKAHGVRGVGSRVVPLSARQGGEEGGGISHGIFMRRTSSATQSTSVQPSWCTNRDGGGE